MNTHGAVASLRLGEKLVQQIFDDWRTAPINNQLRSILGYLEKLTLHPGEVGREDIALLRAAGLSDEAIKEAAAVCTLFSIMNRLADAFGFQVPDDAAKNHSAKIISKIGYRAAGSKKPGK